MTTIPDHTPPPEHNVTGIDYAERGHFCYRGPLIDIHAHVQLTSPNDPKEGLPQGGPDATLEQAEIMLEAAKEFGVERTYSMCPPDDIPHLRNRFGSQIGFNGPIQKQRDEPDDVAYRLLDRYLELGVEIIKFWAAPRGRERGLFVDTPWRIESARRARAAGVRCVMVHVGDPDVWFRTKYADSRKYGTKAEQYIGLRRLLEMFPDLVWIAAHMGGDPEHPDHLQALLEEYPHLYLDTSATKWQVREVSAHRDAIRSLILRHPGRLLFGSDLVTRHHLPREHYISRYWCQRTLWESAWEGPSPIADPDYNPASKRRQANVLRWPFLTGSPFPLLRGLELPAEVLGQLYWGNAVRLLSHISGKHIAESRKPD